LSRAPEKNRGVVDGQDDDGEGTKGGLRRGKREEQVKVG